MDLTAAYDAVWHTGLYYKVSKTTPHSFMDLTAAYDAVWHTGLYYTVGPQCGCETDHWRPPLRTHHADTPGHTPLVACTPAHNVLR